MNPNGKRLEPERFEPEFLKTLLRPYPAEEMASVRVSRLVNKALTAPTQNNI